MVQATCFGADFIHGFQTSFLVLNLGRQQRMTQGPSTYLGEHWGVPAVDKAWVTWLSTWYLHLIKFVLGFSDLHFIGNSFLMTNKFGYLNSDLIKTQVHLTFLFFLFFHTFLYVLIFSISFILALKYWFFCFVLFCSFLFSFALLCINTSMILYYSHCSVSCSFSSVNSKIPVGIQEIFIIIFKLPPFTWSRNHIKN